jgi:hypothetical protein
MSKDKDILPHWGVSAVTARHHHERLVQDEPLYPILSIDELPPAGGLSDTPPREVSRYLRPEEKVVHIHEPEHIWPRRSVTAVEVCMRATRARHIDEIGHKGTTVASVNIGEDDSKLSRYQTQHGRDALQAANDLYRLSPKLLETEVVSLAESQGVENERYIAGHPHGQERVGSIILVNRDRQDRVGQKFTRRLGWGFPYYGSVDAPASFINSIHRLHQKNPSFLKETKYKPRDLEGMSADMSLAFERSVKWLVDNSESNDGLIAYKNPIKGGGIRNQGWRDSANAMVHKTGEWASDEFGIAPIEVQGTAFDAFQNAAKIYREFFNNRDKADELDERSWQLLKIVMEKGFHDGRFVSGFDWDHNRQLRPIDTTTSAAGRLLGSKLARLESPEMQAMVRQTISRLFEEDMVTKWGLRTLASSEGSYVPWGYHNGVWKYDTDVIAQNLSSLGYFGLDRLLGATTTAQHKKTGVFYEHVSGDDSEENPVIPGQDIYVFNESYQEMYLWMQTPPPGQTWSASTEIAKQIRYQSIPSHAADPMKFADEKRIWKKLPDPIQRMVSLHEPDLALALSGKAN